MGKWQLRTWTKGTGAAVEPVGTVDASPAPARPGRPRALPPRGPWTAGGDGGEAAAGSHRTTHEARRRHARRYAGDEAIARLEELEAELLGR